MRKTLFRITVVGAAEVNATVRHVPWSRLFERNAVQYFFPGPPSTRGTADPLPGAGSLFFSWSLFSFLDARELGIVQAFLI